MTQKTKAQALAEYIRPIVENHTARTAEEKRNDLMACEFLRQIEEGEQRLIDAAEYERLTAEPEETEDG